MKGEGGGGKENTEDVLQASKSTGEGNELASHPSTIDVPRQDKGKEGLDFGGSSAI